VTEVSAGTAAEPLISAHGVEISFAGRKTLEHVDLDVFPGEIITLIGPNGAGKSTLIRVMLGLLKPERGRVSRKEGISIGYLPQRLSVDPTLPLTVRSLLCLPRPHPEARLQKVLSEVNVAYAMDRPLQVLSGGELQRVLLARALLRDPDLLVLDEPLQSVDFAGQIALFELIRQVRERRGCGVLMVSHDLHVVMANTDRVLCLNRHVCCSGVPEAVSRHPEYLALFGPRGAESLAIYVHDHDHQHALSGQVVPLAGGEEEKTKAARD